ncbi:MAG: SDR family oxidoreductase [Actinomycetales bacterium]|jgi:NAD(P)-dependent dehydrogenase (short-subunit alcohol dehydrogenase family)|nr:SDR family oxidoreductase [Actinomycetales bacterium]
MSKDFEGLVVVITGSGSGIGAAVGAKMKERGATIFGLDLSEGKISSFGTWVECDISDDSSVKNAFDKIAALSPRVDILVNNAGIGAQGTVEKTTTEEWNKVLNVNVIGTSRVTAAALPLLRKSSSAAIVNTCSVIATIGFPNRIIYSASKGAVLSLTLALAADLLPENIRVNCVNPGSTETPWIQRLLAQAADPVKERAALEARQPLGRLISADEVANAVLYLAHPEQKSTTGTVLVVDGGIHSLKLPK